MSDGEKIKSSDRLRRAHGAYLCARATGNPPVHAGEAPTYAEQYAIALGVHHFFRGKQPISALELLDRMSEDCAVEAMDEAWSTGEVVRLSAAISELFPSDDGPVESAVDCAVRLLRDLRVLREDGKEITKLSRGIERTVADWAEARQPGDTSVDVALRLLGELSAARVLARETVTLVRDAVRREREACAEVVRSFSHPDAPLPEDVQTHVASTVDLCEPPRAILARGEVMAPRPTVVG